MDHKQFLPAAAWCASDYVLRGCARGAQPRSRKIAVPCSPQAKPFLLIGDRVPRINDRTFSPGAAWYVGDYARPLLDSLNLITDAQRRF